MTSTKSKSASIHKTAVITGGASGIGKGIAFECGSLGFDTVILIDINDDKLQKSKA
eukprot:CAMPEP_0201571252 /NCGR_PEP_ID=MMETSP0190_2-20130828/13940_1 /ASSEMBLY_ACC=CAM_ASM_000263 /TAXON_ID=37353 /ORGANISM="Rosalina sp." /LENGTH=55 /DNA_ID=CAMNT_0047995699 /DNA_START=26 /DNA_END=190 /DNA_ORIENTATION=-